MVKLGAFPERTHTLSLFARTPRRIAFASALAAAMAGFAAPSTASASAAAEYLYERALMNAADARCHLFSPEVGHALAAARVQARNAALRAGDSSTAVEATERRAVDKASGVDCRSRGLALAAERLRTAFADYAKLQVMRFPGPQSAWRAERPYPDYHGGPRWGLLQAVLGQGGWVLLGTTGGVVTVLDARPHAAPAASARLVMRDPARLAQPYLDPGRRELAAQAPPRDVSQVFIARSRSTAAKSLLPAGASSGTTYQFPTEALSALARLDPREFATLELVYPGVKGDRIATAWIEIGDLAAAEAFLASGHIVKARR